MIERPRKQESQGRVLITVKSGQEKEKEHELGLNKKKIGTRKAEKPDLGLNKR